MSACPRHGHRKPSLVLGLLLAALLLFDAPPVIAQRCDTSCPEGAPRFLNGCCQPPAPVAPTPPVEVAGARCGEGRLRTIDTAGQCCWPGQAWSRLKTRCVGLPDCPSGWQARLETCEATPAPVPSPAPSPAPGQPFDPKSVEFRNVLSPSGSIIFRLTRTEITVAQYRACVHAGACTPAGTGHSCNAGRAGRDDHPINCVDHGQASAFARWAEGRLPTRAEWIHAATNGGSWTYPWGPADPSCRFAVMNENNGGFACGQGETTAPVCSRPEGNSVQGLCDLAGNVKEWVYDQAADGISRVVLGGGYSGGAESMRGAHHERYGPGQRYPFLGFRVARDAPP